MEAILKIRQLSTNLANKIAAGEVVERPASVVKELVENSIDANSTTIKVALKEAGLTEIKVTDDGEGMAPDDCQNAFLRHATSKIHYDQDLFHISSLGFRGEALASIAAVSKLSIQTSEGHDAGTKLDLVAGKLECKGKSDARKGTEMIVRELFFNTPARLKYMKSLHTELGHITDLMNRYALAHPKIRFEIMHHDKLIFQTAGMGERLQVIQNIYGTGVAKNMLQVQGDSLDFKIDGYIAKPEYTRANRNYITWIVNGRYIKSYLLTQAVNRAYDTLLPIHRFPIAVIAIEMDPVLVDVNVHPTKLEVRFSKEKELMALLEGIVRKTLQGVRLIPEIKQKPKQVIHSKQDEMSFDFTPPRLDVPDVTKQEWTFKERINEVPDRIVIPENVHEVDFPKQMPTHNLDESESQDNRVPTMYPIGQLQGTYILAQNEQGFYMIDQHAAQERIKYEFFKKKLSQTTNEAQQLLMPLTFEFTTKEILFIENHQETLMHAGLFLEHFGGNTYAVRSYPNWFPSGLESEIIRDMVDQIIQKGTISIEQIRDEVAILMACKGSIKANHYLTQQDMGRLLGDLQKTADPFTCPHGRPVIIHHSYYEIGKMFKRIM
jgi:DNA mismatch repair protein MutL